MQTEMPSAGANLRQVGTVLDVEVWSHVMSRHPNEDIRSYVVSGLAQGFRVGFNHAHELRSAWWNMLSADAYPTVVQSYIDKERKVRRIIDPLGAPNVHLNRIGVILNGHTPQKMKTNNRLVPSLRSKR